MNQLNLSGKDKAELIFEISQIIKNGNDSKKIAEYFELNKRILSGDESFEIKAYLPRMPKGVMGLLTPGYKYSVNIKYSTLAVVALLLDLNITSGFASIMMTFTGKSLQTITKIDNKYKCLLSELNHTTGCRSNDLCFVGNECVWNNLVCNYRNDGKCSKELRVVEEEIEELIKEQILINESGMLKIAF